jgi:fluoroacetyl-CoA thioesterase
VKETLAAGLEHEVTYTVTKEMVPPHLPVPVLSTPSMVQLIEATCLLGAQPHLDDDEATVGTHICVSHAAPAFVDESVVVRTRLIEVDRRRLRFEVAVTGSSGTIGEGTHDRFVVDSSNFG